MEQIVITPEELEKLKFFQNQKSLLMNQIGYLDIEISNLLETKKNNLEEYNKTKQQENEYGIQLQEKYGDGNINLDSGIFTPHNQPLPPIN